MSCFADHRSVIANAYHALAPGGYLELQEAAFPLLCHDYTFRNTPLDIWSKSCVQAAANLGRVWTNTPNYKTWMQEIGFEDVNEKIFEVPVGPWPKGPKQKELGLWWQANLRDGAGSSIRVLTAGLGWSREKVELFLVDVRKNIKNERKAIHASMPT